MIASSSLRSDGLQPAESARTADVCDFMWYPYHFGILVSAFRAPISFVTPSHCKPFFPNEVSRGQISYSATSLPSLTLNAVSSIQSRALLSLQYAYANLMM